MDQNKIVKRFIIGTFVALYTLVSVISTIHVIDFFELSNPYWLAVTLAIGFELGAAASLASLVILEKMNKGLVWALFITITLMQMQGNMYYAFTNLTDFQSWSELFNLIEEEPIYQKRILAFVSGAILPLVALGFIKSLVDYIKPEDNNEDEEYAPEDSSFSNVTEDQLRDAEEALEKYREEVLGKDEEEWDEDHAHDQVLNNLLDDLEDEELKVWDNTIADGLQDLDEWEESLENPVEEINTDYNTYLEIQKEAARLAVDEPEIDSEDLLDEAKRRLAKQKMQDFLNQKRNGQESEGQS